MSAIVDIIGREIIDSRGNPTVEAEVVLASGALSHKFWPLRELRQHEGADREGRDGEKTSPGRGALHGNLRGGIWPNRTRST